MGKRATIDVESSQTSSAYTYILNQTSQHLNISFKINALMFILSLDSKIYEFMVNAYHRKSGTEYS